MRLYVICLVLVVCLAGLAQAQKNEVNRAASPRLPVPCDKSLTRFYDRLNKNHFGGRLPRACVLYSPNLLHDTGNEAEVDKDTISQGLWYTFDIRLDPYLRPLVRVSQADVLHEACHIESWNRGLDAHGPIWQSCMRRMALAGAMDELW